MKNMTTLVIAVLVFSSLFLAVPEKGEAQAQGLACCSNGMTCVDNAEEPGAKIPCPKDGEFVEGALCAPDNQCRIERDVPTLSEWGLISMAGILGIIGYIMVIRRQKISV